MAQIQQLAYGVIMQEDVAKGDAVSLEGYKANTGIANQEPYGITQFEAGAGERVAVTVIGVEDVRHNGTLAVGNYVKASAGACVVGTKADAFGRVGKVTGKSAEIILKV